MLECVGTPIVSAQTTFHRVDIKKCSLETRLVLQAVCFSYTGITMVMLKRIFMSKQPTNVQYSFSVILRNFYFCRRYLFIAYQQLVGWWWEWLGQRVRVVLPSYTVNKIKPSFLSTSYAAFKYQQSQITEAEDSNIALSSLLPFLLHNNKCIHSWWA